MTSTGEDPALTSLLEYLRETRGFDFTGYKKPSLTRRIRKRMQAVGVDDFATYRDRLEVDPGEFVQLFDDILINVTGFFRDPEVWDFLAADAIPRVLKTKDDTGLVRVWCAGASSGEEAYSLAMLLAEHMGADEFVQRVKIYATDLDEGALAQARLGSYSPKAVEPIPPDLLNRYFSQTGSSYLFDKEMRRALIFGRHDLVQDAPISRVDLLACRNTLMYFNAETQGKVIGHFYFALNDDGFLVLGKAEMMLAHTNAFTPVDLKRRVFKKQKGELRDSLLFLAQTGDEIAVSQLTNHVRGREQAFEAGPVAQLLIDRKGFLTLANRRARQLFNLSRRDLGRSFQELEISYKPIELRSHVEKVQTERMPILLPEVPLHTPSGEAFVDVEFLPLLEDGGTALGVTVSVSDVTKHRNLSDALEHSNQELETAMEELQSTNEELETTNEELQSTNEELETMNEELQSTNEELSTMNEELRDRTSDLDRSNAFLEAILGNVHAGVIVVDTDMRVRVWNRRSEDMWGLREDEVTENPLSELDIGLPFDPVRKLIRGAIAGESGRITLDAVNRRGKSIAIHVTSTPLRGAQQQIQGTILLIEEATGEEG